MGSPLFATAPLPKRDAGLERGNCLPDLAFPDERLAVLERGHHRPQHRQAVLPAQPLTLFGAGAQIVGLIAMIEILRPGCQRKSEVEQVTAPGCVRIFSSLSRFGPVQVAQYPGVPRISDTDRGFEIMVEDVCKMVMLLGVVELQHLVGVLLTPW